MREIALASQALGRGRPLEALSLVAGRRDAHADAIRGIALAQLGELDRARESLARAVRRFRREPAWKIKAQAALAEVDLARRDLVGARRAFDAIAGLDDPHLDILRARLLGLLGRPGAEEILRSVPWGPAAVLARAELLALQGRFAEAARIRVETENPFLAGEADRLRTELTRPSLMLGNRAISLVELEKVRGPYLDTIRKRFGDVDLSRRPAQFHLLAALARGRVRTVTLFGFDNESARARLRMEVSRLRRATGLRIGATSRGFVSEPVRVLRPAADPVEAILADGEAWPPGAIAAALGVTVRSVERALVDSPRVVAVGRGRARKYRLRRGAGIATQLLLLSARRTGYRRMS